MPRIEDSVFQEEIASSLLSPAEQEQEQAQPEAEASEYSFAATDLLDEAIREQGEDRFSLGDEETERLHSERGEPTEAQREQEQPTLSLEEKIARQEEARTQEQEQSQENARTAELTPQEYKQTIEQTDARINELGLNDDAHTFAAECAPFLGGAALEHAPLLASLTSRATIGARDALLSAYQSGAVDPAGDLDFGKIAPVGPIAARESSRAFAEICGINWQMNPPANEMQLANTLHLGLANLLHAHVKMGGATNPQELNEKQTCVWFAEALQKGLTGKENPISEEKAVQFVNYLTGRVLGIIQKIRAGEQAQQAQGSRSNSGRGRGQRIPAQFREGIKGTRAPKFSSNQDIFDPGVVAAATTQRL
jgi:hypothetical protein